MHKTCPAKIKAAGPDDGLEPGQFKAVVSVFGNRDSYGDIVMPGAFKNTLEDWAARGEAIPVYYSHQMSDPTANIGWVTEAKETDTGLEVTAQLDLEDDAPPMAKYVHRLLKRPGGVRDFSFAYDVIDGGPAKDADGNEYFELRELKLYEVGPTQVGANPATELLAVKRAAELAGAVASELPELKAGRTLSAKNEQTLKDALDSLQSCASSIKNVLASVAASGDEGKAGATGPDSQQQVRESDPSTAKELPGKGATAKDSGTQTPTRRLAAHLSLLALEGASE